jgi:biotin transport system ATP-binding protein
LVTLEKVYFKKDGTLILKDINLCIKNKNTGVIGNNGSGKSSLLRLIKNIEPPSSGQLFTKLNPALIFQNPDHQILCPTVKDELCFGQVEMGNSKDLIDKKLNHLLTKYQVKYLLHKTTHELSEGEKQLICILSALMDEPDIILLDEPFSSLDLKNQKKFMQIIYELTEPIIMASHQLELLEGFDEIIWLESGQVKYVGPAKKTLNLYRKSVID